MSLFDVSRVSVEVGGEEISFETGKLARQAGGAVVVRSGDTMVLCTATAGNLRDVDFLPLTVDVEERHYAAGKIPGSFFRREGRAGERATLTARMIDRPLRPLFPKGWHYETQIVCQPLSVEFEHSYDILAMNGASAAVAVSQIPVPTHVGAVRIGKLHGDFVLNPAEETAEELEMDLVVSGSSEAILMVECGANGVTEAEVLDALDIAHEEIKKICASIEELRSKAGKEKLEVEEPKIDPELVERIRSSHGAKLDEATQIPEKLARQDAAKAVEEEVLEQYASATDGEGADPEQQAEVSRAFDALEKEMIRHRIAVDKKRPDGRAEDEIRPIECEVDISPRVHGSALFTRGETQILSNVALGTSRMDMRIDNLSLVESKTFWHHYNFPPFSVGEAGFMRGPKRRDIGHGALAERALVPTIPSADDFPYVVRVVSETLESNGSSSMGSVCASSMALMAAGVPVSSPVAGVAMGLIKEGEEHVVLTDIAGVEDHLGDMDFKVAGTSEGITALQMDIKISGVTFDILRDALEQARQGRLFILEAMKQTIPGPREELSTHAPRIEQIKIDPEKIGALIGKGGETIRGPVGGVRGGHQRRGRRHGAGICAEWRPGRCVHRAHRGDDQGGRGRRQVYGKGGQDDRIRGVHRAHQGDRWPASHLQREAGRARQRGRGRAQAGRRAGRHRGRGGPRAWAHRPAALQRSGGRGQGRRRAEHGRDRRFGAAWGRQWRRAPGP